MARKRQDGPEPGQTSGIAPAAEPEAPPPRNPDVGYNENFWGPTAGTTAGDEGYHQGEGHEERAPRKIPRGTGSST